MLNHRLFVNPHAKIKLFTEYQSRISDANVNNGTNSHHGVRQVHFKAGDERPLREPGIAVVQERVVVGVVAQAHALR